jgi:hypothetical protein
MVENLKPGFIGHDSIMVREKEKCKAGKTDSSA